jgi:hypothetical protein
LKGSGLTIHPSITYAQASASVKILKDASALFGIHRKEKPMNLSLLQRPKKIKKGTNTMYIYAPAIVTASDVLEPGVALRILDVFEGNNTKETTLKVVKANDWDAHSWGRGMPYCIKNDADTREGELCECEKELSEMSDEFKAFVHYVLLSDVGK